MGEIDIIAWDNKTLCFIEVKTRRSDEYGTPWEAISFHKQKKMTLVALNYLQKQKLLDRTCARFDVLGIHWDEQGNHQIELIKDAMEVEDSLF